MQHHFLFASQPPLDSESQWFLVSYIEHILGKELLAVFASVFKKEMMFSNALPCEVGPFSADEARQIQKQLENTPGQVRSWPGDCLIWQPYSQEIIKPSIFETFSLISEAFLELDENEHHRKAHQSLHHVLDQVQVYSLDRCWAVLFYVGPFIPSGECYLVDHYTKKVFGKRYVDVAAELRKLGYNTPIPKASS